MTRNEILDVIKLLDAGKNPGRGRVEAVIAWLEDRNNKSCFHVESVGLDFETKGWLLE
jgi:hypothetical protein